MTEIRAGQIWKHFNGSRLKVLSQLSDGKWEVEVNPPSGEPWVSQYVAEIFYDYSTLEQDVLSTPRKRSGINCPLCGARDVQALFNFVECYRRDCKNYKEPT